VHICAEFVGVLLDDEDLDQREEDESVHGAFGLDVGAHVEVPEERECQVAGGLLPVEVGHVVLHLHACDTEDLAHALLVDLHALV